MRRAVLQSQTTMIIYCQKAALAGTRCFSVSDFSHNAQDQLDFTYKELDRISVIYVLVMVVCKDHAFCGSNLVSIVNNHVPTSNCPMYTKLDTEAVSVCACVFCSLTFCKATRGTCGSLYKEAANVLWAVDGAEQRRFFPQSGLLERIA